MSDGAARTFLPEDVLGARTQEIVAALERDDWAGLEASLLTNVTLQTYAAAPEVSEGAQALLGGLRALGSTLHLVGPARTTRGGEAAWVFETSGGTRGVDITRLDDAEKVAAWSRIMDCGVGPYARAARGALKAYVERVGRGDSEGALDLFGTECRVEDPVGTPVHEDRVAVEAFYRKGLSAIRSTTLLGEPIVGESGPAAVPFRVDLDLGDRQMALIVIDLMEFDDDGKFRSMRAFWGRANRVLL